MELRERNARWARQNGSGPDASGTGPGPDLGSARRDTRHFINAGRDAIERALSGDSPAFLEASTQVSGQ